MPRQRKRGRNYVKLGLKKAKKGPDWIRRASGLPGIGPWIREAYARWFEWRHALAAGRITAAAREQFVPPTLDDVQVRVLQQLREAGIGKVDARQLCDPILVDKVLATADRWLQQPDVQAQVDAYRQDPSHSWKDYIVRMFGREATIEPDSPVLQLGLQRRLLDVVNSYLSLHGRLIYVDVWNTIPLVHDGPDMGSQRWHRDPEDSRLVKAFLCVSDVGPGAGPLEYIPHSRRGERYGSVFPQRFPAGSVAPAEAIDAVVPSADRERCVGARATLFVVDTAGLHRGGRATRDHRVLATWTYVTPASTWDRAFSLVPTPDGSLFGAEARRAVLS